jgi:hypothetical protein
MYAEKRKHPAVQNADGRECKMMLRQCKTKTQKRKECTSRAKHKNPLAVSEM